VAQWPGFDWCAQVVRRDLVGRIFRCSDRGLLLGRFGIGAQLGIGERGMYYYTVVHIVSMPIAALGLSDYCNGYRATVAMICNIAS
jgi:hypothetical protein